MAFKKPILRLVFVIVVALIQWSISVADEDKNRTFAGYTIDEIVDLYVVATLDFEEGFNAISPHYILKRRDNVPPTLLPLLGSSLYKEIGNFDNVIRTIKNVGDVITEKVGVQLFDTLNTEELLTYFSKNKYWPKYNRVIGVFIGDKPELESFLTSSNIEVFGETQQVALQLLDRTRVSGEVFCIGLILSDAPNLGVISRDFVFIENNSDIEECLYEEIIQGLGLVNDFPAGTKSMFNDDGIYSRPSELDWILLQLHMDDRIKIGMRELEVRAVAKIVLKNIIDDLN